MKTYYERNKKKRLAYHKKYMLRPCKSCGKLCWGSRCRECYLKYSSNRRSFRRKKNK